MKYVERSIPPMGDIFILEGDQMQIKGKVLRDNLYDLIKKNDLPFHIAIIMDGTGRWAKIRGLPRIVGHKKGVDTLKQIVTCAHELGIGKLYLYSFST